MLGSISPHGGNALPNGLKLVKVTLLKHSNIAKCWFYIMAPEHYREDGSCKCNDPVHQKMMIREWGYKRSDFRGIR